MTLTNAETGDSSFPTRYSLRSISPNTCLIRVTSTHSRARERPNDPMISRCGSSVPKRTINLSLPGQRVTVSPPTSFDRRCKISQFDCNPLRSSGSLSVGLLLPGRTPIHPSSHCGGRWCCQTSKREVNTHRVTDRGTMSRRSRRGSSAVHTSRAQAGVVVRLAGDVFDLITASVRDVANSCVWCDSRVA